MIHDSERNRKARRATAGGDSRTPILGGIHFGPSTGDATKIPSGILGRPARDHDALERRHEDLASRFERLVEFLREKGFDFDDHQDGAHAVTA